ncbi:hypothetical protein ASD81_04125 [Nocardioides sp. Root614]|nr:hypothetical protein ASD81_04125 [Nocardioides sp. Root614]KRA91838.1 hypothetical protein ASD84_04390 [Nocardioides sp. Root682]
MVSWDAPVSQRLFYGQRRARCTVDGELAVRRTFEHDDEDIASIHDEWLMPIEPSPFSSTLAVPTPNEVGSHRRRRGKRREGPGAPQSSEASSRSDSELTGLEDMRAPSAVLSKLSSPRTATLRSVLATLQPDQFDVVSEPSDGDVIVQGHPGTGKTVVAAYRSAFLVSPERGRAKANSVLLVGPTPQYVEHVRDLLRPLDRDGRVTITHIAHVLDQAVSIKGQWLGGIGGEHDEVDARAQVFGVLAEERLRSRTVSSNPRVARREHIRMLYELVRNNGDAHGPLSEHPADVAWMNRLPSFDQAVRLRRYLPLLAQLARTFDDVRTGDQFDHVVVDEAQDLSPIEWNVLEQHLRQGGHWTLVGDMNQRRSAATYPSWMEVARHLGLRHNGTAVEPTALRRGYRSTTPILRFADRLLLASERGASSIQSDGPEPAVRHIASRDALIPEALASASRLLTEHPGGTVAIITMDPGMVIDRLGRQGWRRGQTATTWTTAELSLSVLAPENARGLEFDGVVVIEPGVFPENQGRAGQLYTSLTRANRELEVVWHRSLPPPLRTAGRG